MTAWLLDLARLSKAPLPDIPGDLWVGLSGGVDSVVLLDACVRLFGSEGVRALHVDHGIDPNAAQWADHCRALCADLGVPIVVERLGPLPQRGLEVAAREARYAAFAQHLGAADTLALAHHADDQAETVLLRLVQGRGVYGMPAVRGLSTSNVVRPLIETSRAAIEGYARDRGLEWIDDPSNADSAFDRNFLRNEILPTLAERWGDRPVRGLLRAASAMRAKDEAGTALVAGFGRALPVDAIGDGDAGVQALRWWVPGIEASDALLAELLRQVARSGRGQLTTSRHQLRGYQGKIYRVLAPPALDARYPVRVPGTLALPHGKLEIVCADDGFLADVPLHVRWPVTGDRIHRADGSRAVSKLFSNGGVPPWERSTYPLVCSSDAVVCVPDLAVRADVASSSGGGTRCKAHWSPK